MYDFIVATICLLGLVDFFVIPLPVLMACTIVYLYGKLAVPKTA